MNPKEKKPSANPPKIQGEGDYDAARDYDRDVKDFVKREGRNVENLARDAAKALDGKEAKELSEAEKAGRSKAKDEDPAITQR
jgi:hypothetical protein